MTSRTGGRTALAAALAGLSVLPVAALPGSASAGVLADQQACDVAAVPDSEPLAPADTRSNPAHQRMHVAEAHELARGRGTKIAVIDSGVLPVGGVRRVPLFLAPGAAPGILSGHGTIVGGLIAGEDGVAPEATVYDVKVFDAEGADPTEGQRPVTSAGIVDGIRAVVRAFPRERFDVVNISLAVPSSDPRLEAAVRELVALDTVVVAAAGNRVEGSEETGGTADSDADVFPADYPGVLGVSAVPPGDEDPGTYVLPNRDTDVAAPTAGAVSVNATGQRCVVGQVATSWAAAEVSGLVALLRERYPRDTARQTIARLEATTEGAGAAPEGAKAANPWTGAGVVQAHDALTRQVQPDRRGRVVLSEPETRADASAPPASAEVDLFGSSRALLLWTGLLAGALLALAFMLRPLLRRR
jgi:membrane-anchored mycosin MYCP